MALLILKFKRIKKKPTITLPFEDFESILIQYSMLQECYDHCHEEDSFSYKKEEAFKMAFDIGMDHYINRREELIG